MKTTKTTKATKSPKLPMTELQTDRLTARTLVRVREDFQAMRKRMDNRLGRRADGAGQNIEERRGFSFDDKKMFERISTDARKLEDQVEKDLELVLSRFPIYTDWLKPHIKGVGTIAAGWIVGEYDIHKATTVSKLTQFTGLNPGLVFGKKRIENKDGTFSYETTDIPIKGDRLTPGFVAPFNKRLRTAMVGVLADGFLKAGSTYAKFYYDQHISEKYRKKKSELSPKEWKTVCRHPELVGQHGRLDSSEQMTTETKKGGNIVPMMWKETTDGHRDRAAKRYMIKRFLQDLYVEWRTLEGLPMRKPYAEEFLGKKHEE